MRIYMPLLSIEFSNSACVNRLLKQVVLPFVESLNKVSIMSQNMHVKINHNHRIFEELYGLQSNSKGKL